MKCLGGGTWGGGGRQRKLSCFGIASWKHLDMPAYPLGTYTASLSNFQGLHPGDLHSKAMRPDENSVTADGFHDARRSKAGTWARGAGVCVCSWAPGGGGAGRGDKALHPPAGGTARAKQV